MEEVNETEAAFGTGRGQRAFVTAVASTRMPMIFINALSTAYPIVFANNAFLKMAGYTRQEIVFQPLSLVLNFGRRDAKKLIAAARKDEDQDFCCRRQNGSSFWATVLVSPVIDETGTTTHLFASLVDQTRHIAERTKINALNSELATRAAEIRALQALMIQSSRLSAIGMAGATMAHELNQPLAAITNYIRGARRRLAATATQMPDGVLDALDHADRGAMRASDIIRRVREVAKQSSSLGQQENLRGLILEACDLALMDVSSHRIEMRFNFDVVDPDVVADRIQIQQVVINLVCNALDAVTGSMRRVILVSTIVRPDKFCEISVSDTGPGVAEQAMGKLFESFHTTKTNGVGIGLSISRAIIEAHGGQLWLASSTDDGADFRFSLPLPLEGGTSTHVQGCQPTNGSAAVLPLPSTSSEGESETVSLSI